MENVRHKMAAQTVARFLRRHGLTPAPKRGHTYAWKDFIGARISVLSGIDFFTVEALSRRGLVTCYVLFLVQLETRKVMIAGITRHPNQDWMEPMARNITDESDSGLRGRRYIIHDRDAKFCASFRATVVAAGQVPLRLSSHSPNLNAFAERWVRSVKQECLHKLVLFGEGSVKRALVQYVEHYHTDAITKAKGIIFCFPPR